MTKSAAATALANPPPAANIQRAEPVARFDSTRMLPAERLTRPGYGWLTHEATLPADTPHEHILNGGYWRKSAARFNRGDHIRWRDDSLTQYGELVVVAIDAATLNLELRELWIKQVEPMKLEETEKNGFTPKFLGQFDGWAIYRDFDGIQMAKNIKSRDEAMRRVRTEYLPGLKNQAALSAASR